MREGWTDIGGGSAFMGDGGSGGIGDGGTQVIGDGGSGISPTTETT